jgi:hypothetical protein
MFRTNPSRCRSAIVASANETLAAHCETKFMANDLDFDVAFSYSSNDAWIARDLSKLIAQSGLTIYCYDNEPDRVAGFLRSKLLDIYRDSRLNVVLWSRSYASAMPESFPAMECRCVINRHVEKGDAQALLLISLDDETLTRAMDTILAHDIRRQGVLRTARLIIERIGKISAGRSSGGLVQHPVTTEAERGQLYPCTFVIHPSYQTDPRGRWQQLADVLVRFPNPLRTRDVYLIPSGLCSPLLRHSDILRTEPELLERKRAATVDFVQRQAQSVLAGFWFALKRRESEVVTVYAPTYDAALNASLQGDAGLTNMESTRSSSAIE